jgi:hypothetical protein
VKQLVVNADDFGFTRDVNQGIVEAHRNGILTATTLMAPGDAFDDAVRRWMWGVIWCWSALRALHRALQNSCKMSW